MTNSSIFYIFYGLIQGITEFIPISSSGHLNILEILFKKLESRNYFHETSAHFASLLALLLYWMFNYSFYSIVYILMQLYIISKYIKLYLYGYICVFFV